MEREESEVEECRHGDVTVRIARKEGSDGRTWPNYRVGRYYSKDRKEHFTVDLNVNDLPLAAVQLIVAYLKAKAIPQALRNGTDE